MGASSAVLAPPALAPDDELKGIQIRGNNVTVSLPGGSVVTLALPPGYAARVGGADEIGDHLRRDVEQALARAVDGATFMIGAVNQEDVCGINSAYEVALARAAGTQQIPGPSVTSVTDLLTRGCKCYCGN
ncbi:MAG TPA: hypothetical protein VMR98_00770 [Candidatus Polarisedimenticolaceae bacterium]|nr:hypothetical protein [Candidatus Polarisedimenticolaceae bacterium]